MKVTKQTIIAVAAAVLTGCASATPERTAETTGRTSDGALLKLHEEPYRPVWADWTPAGPTQATPEGLEGAVRAFDYWEVDDTRVIEEVWGAIFPVLDNLRGSVEADGRRQTLDLMLAAIEPGQRQERATRMDLTFLVSAGDRPFEGFACRLYRPLDDGATPAVTLLLLRDPSGSERPGRIVLWAAPGFEEPAAMTADFRRRAEGWSQRTSGGLTLPDDSPAETYEELPDGKLIAGVLTNGVWKRFAGKAYLESPQSGARSERARPEGIAEALGLEVGDRSIDQVFSGTVFPPRAEVEDLEF